MTTQQDSAAPAKFTLSEDEFAKLIAKAGEAGAKAHTQAPPAQDEAAPLAQAGAVGALVEPLDNIGGLGIPFGSVLIGAIPGVVVGELIDGFVPPKNDAGTLNWLNPVAKVGAAYLGVQYGAQLIGRTGVMFFAGALALQALSNVLPIDQWIANLTRRSASSSAVAQAEQVAREAQLSQSFNPAPDQGGMWA